jgi:hypothetical protein
MREFKSLRPEKLLREFDAAIHSEEPIVEVTETKGKIVIAFTFPGFYLVEDSRDMEGGRIEFKQVNIAKVGFLAESGKPLLPSFGRYVQIPFDTDYKVAVKKGRKVEFDDVHVLPAQERITDSSLKKHAFEYDKHLYGMDGLYPEEMVRVSGPFVIDDYRSLLVHVCPFQYNPAKKKLTGYGNITVTIAVKQRKGRVKTVPAASAPVDREAFGNLFLNPGRGIEERLGLEQKRTFVRPTGPMCLIVFADAYQEAAAKLAAWKNRRGLMTETVSISAIGNDISRIKAFIRSRRKRIGSRLRYVLLFGDAPAIIPETIPSSPWGPNTTDYYYSTEVDATEEKNNVLAWLSIGRIPVRSAAEGMGVVDQIIAYEKNPPAESGYYRRMAFAAFFQEDDQPGTPGYGKDDRGYLKTIEDIRAYMVSLGYDGERIYVSNNPAPQFYNDGTPIPGDVKNAFVQSGTATKMLVKATTGGRLIIAHRDHGDWNGWVHPTYTVTDLDAVTGNMPTLFFSINCLTGQFDYSVTTESFAEKNLRMNGTAPSLIAATRVSHTWLNNHLLKALFDSLFGGLLPTFPGGTASYPVKFNRLGDMLNYAKSYLPVASTDTAYIKDHFEIYHVVGDPTLEIWKEEPRSITLRTGFRADAIDIHLSECPKGCVITLYSGDRILKRIEPSSTRFSVRLKDTVTPLPGKPPAGQGSKEIFVCFWAPGYRFYEVCVRVER